MHVIFRFAISIGLIITALSILNLQLTQGLLMNDQQYAYLNSSFTTTCVIMFKDDSHCSKIRTLIAGLLISSAFCLLLSGNSMMFKFSAFSLSLWIIFYANPYLDTSNASFQWFLQAAAVVAGLLAAGSIVTK